jgi:basic amino acid/polyamine antiporter, APA family
MSSNPSDRSFPRASLSVMDGIGMIIGVVIGIGIFRTPSLVAANVDSQWAFMGLWLLGGVITLAGAIVYAELSAQYPSAGGEYTFLSRALGRNVALLFAWGRISVVQTGAIAAVAFVFGDYAQAVVPLGAAGPAIYAVVVVVVMTLANLRGTHQGKTTQNVLSGLTLGTILLILIFALPLAVPTASAHLASEPSPAGGMLGLAMVFILLTYGGWNEVAYISAEVRDGRRNLFRVLVLGTMAITLLYLVINFAYLAVLGLEGLRASRTVAADMMQLAAGSVGSVIVSLAICVAALSTLNASIFTVARLYFAVGSDLNALSRIGAWDAEGNSPRRALLLQSTMALALVVFGALQRDGFQTMVEYTAPVFWLFMVLIGISYFIVRHRDRHPPLLLSGPLYPVVPALFTGACGYLLYASLMHTGLGALVGAAVLLTGIPVILFLQRRDRLVAAE